MECIAGTSEFYIDEPTVVTIGKFDGRHKGHQKLLHKMLELKQELGYKTAVFTFDTAPLNLVGGTSRTVITTNEERRNNMDKMGIDYLVEYPFTEAASRMPPEEFIRQILVGNMHARAVVAGTDCGFGYRRAGDADLLRSLSETYGYQAFIIDKEQDRSRDISSTYVKEELDRGNMEKVNELLGEPYSIHGIVVHGNHIGGPRLGFPTANIVPPAHKHLPPFGVYVSKVSVNGILHGGVTNIGRKPTVGGESPVGVETFIFDLEQDIYGSWIEVQLFHYSRPEQKFASLDDLKAQISKDKDFARMYLDKMSSGT